MDKGFWDRVERTFGQFKGSAEFQEYCWEVYKANKEEIKELIRLRQFLHIDPASSEDKALGYLIHRMHDKHGIRWKAMVRTIISKAVKSGVFNTSLSLAIEELLLEDIQENGNRGTANTVEKSRDFIGFTHRKLAKKANIDLVGPHQAFLPDWFFIARPENDFYSDQQLEKIINPLIDREIAEDDKHMSILNALHELLLKHGWKNDAYKSMLLLLQQMAARASIIRKHRADLKVSKSLDSVKRLESGIKKKLLSQFVQFEKLSEAFGKRSAFPSDRAREGFKNRLKELRRLLQQEIKEVN